MIDFHEFGFDFNLLGFAIPQKDVANFVEVAAGVGHPEFRTVERESRAGAEFNAGLDEEVFDGVFLAVAAGRCRARTAAAKGIAGVSGIADRSLEADHAHDGGSREREVEGIHRRHAVVHSLADNDGILFNVVLEARLLRDPVEYLPEGEVAEGENYGLGFGCVVAEQNDVYALLRVVGLVVFYGENGEGVDRLRERHAGCREAHVGDYDVGELSVYDRISPCAAPVNRCAGVDLRALPRLADFVHHGLAGGKVGHAAAVGELFGNEALVGLGLYVVRVEGFDLAESCARALIVAVEILPAAFFEKVFNLLLARGIVGADIGDCVVVRILGELIDLFDESRALGLALFCGGVFSGKRLGGGGVPLGHGDLRARLRHYGLGPVELGADFVGYRRIRVLGKLFAGEGELAGGLVPVALVHEVVGFVNQIVCGYNLKLLFADGVRHGGVHRLDLGLRLSGLGGGSFCDFCGCSLCGFGNGSFRGFDFFNRAVVGLLGYFRDACENGSFALGLTFNILVYVGEHALYALVIRGDFQKLFKRLLGSFQVARIAGLHGRNHKTDFLLGLIRLGIAEACRRGGS